MLSALLSSIPLALRALAQYPLRACLTAFGILIGVAAVVVTVALGEGAERAVQQQLSQLGENPLSVRPERVQQRAAGAPLRLPRLTERDGDALRRDADSLHRVAPVLRSQQTVLFGGLDHRATAVGTELDYLAIRGRTLQLGEAWSTQAEKTAQRVCVLGQSVREQLFGPENPVGRVLRIGRHPFRILGVLNEKGTSQFGQDQDDVVLMPLSTLRSKLQPSAHGQVDELLLSPRFEQSVEPAKQQATAILRQRHGLFEGARDDFRIRSQSAFGESRNKIVAILGLLLTSIAAISLLVGGIGIMNIMLVSVTERTRDIGISMAVGATRAHILTQFLVESVVLSMLGGTLGTLLSLVTVSLLQETLHLPMSPSPLALTMALGVSLLIGVVFGVVPARKASGLDPIEALGRE